ncbi:rubredoxin [Aeromicrobium sp. Sec7.5]|uniref:rubredoxin n=1 Tax=Aeromicrobium sp. Sec7.5 TaxID=3121276 RepID=UPI002FE45DE3
MAKFICPNCEFVYDESMGIPREGWPAGTPFVEVDEDWTCPDCGVREQVDFLPIEEFVRNDQDGNVISQETREQALARQRAELERQKEEEQA